MKRSFLIGVLVLIGVALVVAAFAFQHLSKPQTNSLSPAAVKSDMSTFEKIVTPKPQPIKLLFGGDLMFDRHIRLHMAEHGNDFVLADLVPTLSEYDGVIANLEGPITDNPSKSLGSAVGSSSNFIFTFDTQIADLLKEDHFTLLNLGNNHIRNFGNDGVVQTKNNLDRVDLDYFGDTATETESSQRIAIEEYGDLKIAFVNYNQFVDSGFEHTLADIEYAKSRADLIVIYTHWGIEYLPEANQVIQDQAHQLIKAGGDVIIGSHPHVVEQHEDYLGKRIYYSLGNFVFDQYFSPEVQQGLLVEMTINPDKTLIFREIPITLKSTGQTVLK